MAAIGLVVCLGLAAPAAQATMPGSNGRISFVNDGEMWTVNPDGTGELNTHLPGAWSTTYEGGNDWSPDGGKVAFGRNPQLYTANADGSGQVAVTDSAYPVTDGAPSWSPDGSRIAFTRRTSQVSGPATYEIWIIGADGSDPQRLATSTMVSDNPQWHPDGNRIGFLGCNYPPGNFCTGEPRIIDVEGTNEQPLPVWGDFSPDGTKVVFQDLPPGASYPYHDIFVQNLDGSGRVNVTSHPGVDREPAWSPDGTKIVFRSGRRGDGPRIYTINPDGSGVALVTERQGLAPQWQPIHTSYPRPKGATPLFASLVPAYAACDAPDATHGPPLAFDSCSPPAQASSALTVGTADSNGRASKSVSWILLDVLAGSPSTPADEADVQVTANVTDVYQQGTLADYAGDVQGRIGLRITDKLSSQPGGAGTVTDTTLAFAIPCSPTVDTTAGAACVQSTSVDALTPGAVPEGGRSIWALGQVEVDDASGAPFMRQGVFVP